MSTIEIDAKDLETVTEALGTVSMHGNSQAVLRAIIERVERMNDDIAALMEDRKTIFSEAKSAGFDLTTIRHIIKLRKMDDAKRQEADALLATYMHAIGMPRQLPLF